MGMMSRKRKLAYHLDRLAEAINPLRSTVVTNSGPRHVFRWPPGSTLGIFADALRRLARKIKNAAE